MSIYSPKSITDEILTKKAVFLTVKKWARSQWLSIISWNYKSRAHYQKMFLVLGKLDLLGKRVYLAIFNVWNWYRAQERLFKEQLRINFVIRGRVENGSDCHAFQIAITFVPSFFREKKIKIKIKVQLQAERKQNVCSLCFKPRRGKTTLITALTTQTNYDYDKRLSLATYLRQAAALLVWKFLILGDDNNRFCPFSFNVSNKVMKNYGRIIYWFVELGKKGPIQERVL